jgi:hypothetical protein
MSRGAEHNPSGQSGDIDWTRPVSGARQREFIERGARNIMRDYGPAGIGRRFGQVDFVGYPLHIDRVSSLHETLTPLNEEARGEDFATILEQVDALSLKPEKGLWRYILQGHQKMHDTSLGRYIAIRRALHAVEAIIRKGATTHQITALCAMFAENHGKLYVHHRDRLAFVTVVGELSAEDVARKLLPKIRNREFPVNVLLKFQEGKYHLFGGAIMHSHNFKKRLVKHFKEFPVY